MNKKIIYIAIFAGIFSACNRHITSYGPVPTKKQLEWQKMEMNMFCHFGPNTFSGAEWGNGKEPEDMFNPTSLDCNQWTKVAKLAGFGGIIITAKHHDGFSLWPNPFSTHTVSQSLWRNGKGDVLKELSEACKNVGIKFGVYLSPWDRNHPTYGTDKYNEVYRNTLDDIYSKYGDIFEHWFDGANGEGPNGKKQVYDWTMFNSEILKYSPNTVIFSDIGPDCRWVGNERGVAGRTNWSTLNISGFTPGAGAPPKDTLNSGNMNGEVWVPIETDVSIRKGWFYHSDEHPRSLKELLDIYYTSVGRNSVLLLNVPPDTRGLIASEDSLRLIEFKAALDDIFKDNLAKNAKISASSTFGCKYKAKNLLKEDYDKYWAAKEKDNTAEITLKLNGEKKFNRILLGEYIPLGQRVAAFHIDILCNDNTWKTVATETTIGYKRIIKIGTVKTRGVRVVIDKTLASPILNTVGLYYDKFTD